MTFLIRGLVLLASFVEGIILVQKRILKKEEELDRLRKEVGKKENERSEKEGGKNKKSKMSQNKA